jgi:hypothetical protein
MGFTPNGWLIVACPHAEHVYIVEAVFGHGKQSQQIGSSKLKTFPGQCISIGELESLTVDLITQLKGILNRTRYNVAMVFNDNFSCLSSCIYRHCFHQKTHCKQRKIFRCFESQTELQWDKELIF